MSNNKKFHLPEAIATMQYNYSGKDRPILEYYSIKYYKGQRNMEAAEAEVPSRNQDLHVIYSCN
jgi:hypothetical protein